MDSEALSVLDEIRRWVRIIGIQEAREVLEDALSDEIEKKEEELRIIYHLTNGENSTRHIASHVSVSRMTVSNRQRQWAKMGLVEKSSPNSPYQHVISLEEAGMEVPEIEVDNNGK